MDTAQPTDWQWLDTLSAPLDEDFLIAINEKAPPLQESESIAEIALHPRLPL